MVIACHSGDKMMLSSSVTTWVSQVATLLEARIMWTQPAQGETAERVHRGAEALTLMLEHHQKPGQEPKTIAELHWLSVFRHKLSSSDLALVGKWRNKIMKTTKSVEAAPKSAAGSKKPTVKQQKSEGSMNEAVRAALRLPSKKA
eukprot:2414933-Amphidinium_carterae.1